MKTIRGLLLAASLLFSVAGIIVIYLATSWIYERSIREQAVAQANTLAQVTFNSMFQLMNTGWNRRQMEGFIAAIQGAVADTGTEIHIYRGDKVVALFGPVEQPEMDVLLTGAMRSGEPAVVRAGTSIRYVFPLRAESICQRCHVNVQPGDVLGAIDVRQAVSTRIAEDKQRFMAAFLPLLPLAIAATLLMVFYINRRLERSLAGLAGEVRAINRVSDLQRLQARHLDFGFAELGAIASEIETLAQKLRGVAVDRDMLQFEINLLEKFIITSEVVRDWREYVNRLLMEIDGVMEAYALFSIFKVGDEVFDLEVFWRNRPQDGTQRMFEEVVRQSLARNPNFADGYAVRVVHTVADASRDLPALDERDLEVQTKSLLVAAPKIGGIVGIGVQAQLVQDATRALVIESILSTLLNVVGSVKAIHKYTKDLEYYATRDPLTNLYNQRVFWELLENEIGRAARHGYRFGLIMVDVDNFKSVNDTYGHGVGDALLQQITLALQDSVRGDDMLARYGGDEFAAIMPEAGFDETLQVAQRMLESAQRVSIAAPDGTTVRATLSVGFAVYPDHAVEKRDLFLFADSMMYRAKTEGKNRVAVPEERDVIDVFRSVGEKSIVILKAVDEKRVVPYFQAIVDASSGAPQAVEVLSRIDLGEKTVLPADEFVAIAEKMGVMHKLDYLVMDRALDAAMRLHYEGLVFLNMSPRALVLNDFVAQVRRIAESHRIDPGRLVFEITERETIKNMVLLEKFIQTLKHEGFGLAIDDFGSGFSSFHYVKRFPIDFLKIEGDFIANMVHSDKDLALVRSMVALAGELNMRTVAESVESAEILASVVEQGIELAQGHHIGRPNPDLAAVLRRRP